MLPDIMFTESNWNGVFNQNLTLPASSNYYTKYEAKDFVGPGTMQFFADNQLITSVAATGGTPDEAQQFAELHNTANQVPGAISYHGFFGWSFYTTSDGVNHYFNASPAATIVSDPPYSWAAHSPVDVYQLDVWDTACP